MSDPLGANIADDDGRDRRPRTSDRGRARRPTAPGSLGFAATVAALGLVVSLGSGLGTIYVPRLWPAAPSPAPLFPSTSPSWPTTGYSTRTTTTTPTVLSGAPVGFYRHTGPKGLVTVLPNSFVTGSGQAKGTQVAKNPADPDVEVRFGGDVEGPSSLVDTIRSAADDEAGKPGYTEVALTRTTHGGLDAVDWEFVKPNANGDPRRTSAHYWRVGGVEYVLLVVAPPDRFPAVAATLTTMTYYSETP